MASRRFHILVVDDDRDLRESVTEILEAEGYAVAGASDGLQALAYLGSCATRPDLILLDMMMPHMNGLRFREEQLRCIEYANIPVVVLTADRHMKEKVSSLGVAGFLSKPPAFDALLALIDRVLEATSRAEGE